MGAIDSRAAVVGVLPRISPERFTALLEAAGSPAAAEGNACWQAVAAEGVDPLFALAVFWHESRFGTAGVVAAHDLRNPGATRTSRTGVGEPVAVPGRGQFWRYPSWTEGFRDLARRLVDPDFVYRRQGAATVERIVPLWAPASDGNDPAAYAAAVSAFIAQYASDPVPGLPLRLALLPPGAPNRPGYPLRPAWVTVHETANEDPGAGAEAHRRFVHAGGGPEGVSFHFVVDDREAVQLLPTTENGWHAGDGVNGTGNRASIGIELCVNRDGDWSRTQEHGARLVAALCRAFGLGPERVVPHQYWSGKTCPRRLLAQGFDAFRERVRGLLGGGEAVSQEVVEIGPFGKHVGHGFLAFWRQLERIDQTLPIRALGWPLTEEFDIDGIVYQVFERGVLKWARGEPQPWDVHVAPFEEAERVRAVARARGILVVPGSR
ncbi:N-acetylmuramoyl-L-alanine amidase (plasmid) [Thermomicrobium sp. 4228-Ro]|uniref:peptidoglycan recognition protein family protein n=1 Tax=Thermomicrobium sp. 4228-Ro TaxID=2993937 RepID=UPI0022499DD6|nr:N-acetylmuramoyl-L-alanine amidase [Thermomicrobium sp. 4228-Ro]MCX2728571.1 N-acetylmuramoyl-L-alanine amidase [Thermomicrobium sp. 4228-Ro]